MIQLLSAADKACLFLKLRQKRLMNVTGDVGGPRSVYSDYLNPFIIDRLSIKDPTLRAATRSIFEQQSALW